MAKFELLTDDEPDFKYRCECGNEFWVDPITEENLFICTNEKSYGEEGYHRHLEIECPKCGRKRECSGA